MARELYNSEDKSRNNIMAASSSGFVYSDIVSSNNPTASNSHHHHHHHHLVNQIQGFEPNPSDQQIFSLNTGMGMIDFSKQQQQRHHHQITSAVEEISGENLMMIGSNDSSTNWQLQENNGTNNKLLLEDSSSLRCVSVFPCEGNERPSQGLSLSLSSSNPTTISLQSFELRQPQPDHHDHDHVRQGYFGKSVNAQQAQMMMMMAHQQNHGHQGQFQIRSSKYLGPAQELLNEFCSLGNKQSEVEQQLKQQKSQKGKQVQLENVGDEPASTSSRKPIPLHSLEFMELQKRKTKLIAMLEELDQRYRHYRDQMRTAVSSFEAVAGAGSASVYTALASKAMSRHFRCLRDGIVGQIQAIRNAMGEKDPVVPGTTRGETPRLRLLDQAFRQQKAYQQMSMMEAHPWRPQRGLPERAVSVLRAWLFEHFLHPYPSDVDKHILARQTGLSRSQVSNWFINARVRLWKPMVEEMYLEETKEEQGHNNTNPSSSDGLADLCDNQSDSQTTDLKPKPNQLIRIDPESLSSIISNQTHKSGDPKAPKSYEDQQGFGSTFDFTSYGHQGVTYAGDSTTQGFSCGTGGVSLTLGLQQHGGSGGMSLAFSQASQGSLFYSRDQIEDCQQGVQYSLLDGDQGQALPYRNLMGAQLLHDMV